MFLIEKFSKKKWVILKVVELSVINKKMLAEIVDI